MSGISLAVGPRSDPANGERQQHQNQSHQTAPPPSTMLGGVMGSLRVIELQLVAFIMVFSASGLVPLIDLAFPIATTLYLLLLSRLVFPPLPSHLPQSSHEIFRGTKWFQAYVVVGTTVGLFLPLAHVLGGFARGDEGAVKSATPHLFLLSCQILTENVVGALGGGAFSPPVRALVPLLYTVRRVFVVLDWVYDVWANRPPVTRSASLQEAGWVWFGRYLAVANLFLPRAFEKYFQMRDEVVAKSAEDRPAADAKAKKAE
uniref:DUF7733 domain-containing protein n=1 Tax=Leersia perrieri TaxID=77586 RepID=A0A0D9W437_9ORYZ